MKINFFLNPIHPYDSRENSGPTIIHRREESEQSISRNKRFKESMELDPSEPSEAQNQDYISKLSLSLTQKILSYLPLRDSCYFGAASRKTNAVFKSYLSSLKCITFSPFHFQFEMIERLPPTSVKNLTLHFELERSPEEIKKDLEALETGFKEKKFSAVESLHISIGNLMSRSGTWSYPVPLEFIEKIDTSFQNILLEELGLNKIIKLQLTTTSYKASSTDLISNFFKHLIQNTPELRTLLLSSEKACDSFSKILEKIKLTNLERIESPYLKSSINYKGSCLLQEMEVALSHKNSTKKTKIDLQLSYTPLTYGDDFSCKKITESYFTHLITGGNKYFDLSKLSLTPSPSDYFLIQSLKKEDVIKIDSLNIFYPDHYLKPEQYKELREVLEKHNISKIGIKFSEKPTWDILASFLSKITIGINLFFEFSIAAYDARLLFQGLQIQKFIDRMSYLESGYTLNLESNWTLKPLSPLLGKLPISSLTLFIILPENMEKTLSLDAAILNSFRKLSENSSFKQIHFQNKNKKGNPKLFALLKRLRLTSSSLHPIKVTFHGLEIM
jgi:hypothetical protein